MLRSAEIGRYAEKIVWSARKNLRNAEKSEGTPKNYSGALKTFDSLKKLYERSKIFEKR
ncbi:hypothetical protein GCM10010978_28280 [Compostibacillus humi]|uniref:Uncharacterized protein n=1 Tax=Compostibacillus humi TaxID=1245525 RepID=A0A8J2XA35_9BACI|nr:hypothetical protein GCM10010978_28280 [Compostibacillus humi]